MSENLSPISIVKRLHELDLFYVTTLSLVDLFDLPSAFCSIGWDVRWPVMT